MTGTASAQGPAGSLYAAHRGGSLLWPENSLLAFRNAVALGADYLELDVHRARDGQVVVIHDPTLDRTTTGSGAVADRSLAELRQLRLKDKDGRVTEETVPTLDEVLETAVRGGRRVLLEIKVDPARRRYAGIEELVLAAVDRHRMADRAVIMAFEPETWQRVRALRPEVTAGALYSARMLERSGATLASVMEEMRRAGVAFIGLHQALVDADTVALARRAGLTLGVWTVNDREPIARFIRDGVRIVITDRPDIAKELLGR
jgi:glycerophosphoryl diester phosphodiesterase